MNRKRTVGGRTMAALCVMTALAAACASRQQQPSASPPPPAQRVNQAGYSDAFRQGYADGCNSVQSSRRRNEKRYQSDTDYMMGWNDGFGICSKRK